MKKFLIISILCISTSLDVCAELPWDPCEPDGYIGGFAYVDLGLPSGTLWAVHNIGASNEFEPGDYFAWGETEPKDVYLWETYKYFIRYTNDPDPNAPYIELEDIGYCISGTEYDAAVANWGNGWTMPDSIQLAEMRWHTFGVLSNENGIDGVRVYSKEIEGKSIFLGNFSVGYMGPGVFRDVGGYYWSGTSTPGHIGSMRPTDMARNIMNQLYSHDVGWNQSGYKFGGCCIRPVNNKKNCSVDYNISNPQNITLSLLSKTLRVNKQISNGHCEFRDICGRLQFSHKITDNECDVSNIPSGIYIATVKEDNIPLISRKIIIK